MKRILIAAVGAASLSLVLAGTSVAGGDTVYAPKNCTKPKVEPNSITLTCADSGAVLGNLKWSEWNQDKVKGKGKLFLKDCKPNCAEGGTDKYKVRVTLLHPAMTMCGGQHVQMYRRAHLRFPDEKPPKKNKLKSFQLSCSG